MKMTAKRRPGTLKALAIAGICNWLCGSYALADKQLLWGDTHLHTSNSGDSFLNGNLSAGPDTAYRFARGLPVIHPGHRGLVQIDTPLDFLVVADHAEYLGVPRTIYEHGVPREELSTLQKLYVPFIEWYFRRSMNSGGDGPGFGGLLPATNDVRANAAVLVAEARSGS